MRVLTDGYVKLGNEQIKLSGISAGAPEYAAEIISELSGGNAKVTFKPIDSEAKELVKATFGDVYKENAEGCIIEIADDVTVYADTKRAMIFAANSILGHYDGGISKGVIYNYPRCEHRSARVYLPPKSEMPYFKKFIDTLSYHGCNAIVLEVAGAMEFKRHPEINEYWKAYAKELSEFNGKTYKLQISKRIRNSVHTYNAGGDVYSQEELRELCEYCAKREIEIIPEIPSLTHSEYILGAHPELAECDDEFYPDTCCPQNEGLYKLVFELYDEAIEVFKPKTLHIGHDEWWVMCICDKCKGEDPAKLFADNVNRCYEYLKSKGVETMFWNDKMLELYEKTGEPQAAAYKKIYSTDSGQKVTMFGKEYTRYIKHWYGYPDDIEEKGGIPHEILGTAACAELINPEIKAIDWEWACEKDKNTRPLQRGMWTIYGNAECSCIQGWEDALEAGVKGFSVSNWLQTDEMHNQRYATLFDLGYGALMAWARDYDEADFEGNTFKIANDMYFFRNKDTLSGPHIEITHNSDIVADKNPGMGRPYIENADIRMGEYVIEYEDGKKEKFEVLFNSNIGLDTVNFVRPDSKRFYCYDVDNNVRYPVAICDYIKDGEKMWYKIAVPTGEGVKNVTYIPEEEYKDNLHIKEIVIK